MKKTLVCLLVVSLVVMVAFNVFAADKKFKMAFVPGVADPFYYTMEKGAQAMAKKLGVELIVGEYPKSWGPEAQVPIIEAIIARGDIDLFFTAPTSTEALIPVLKKIHDKGIPVITVIPISAMVTTRRKVISASHSPILARIMSRVGWSSRKV